MGRDKKKSGLKAVRKKRRKEITRGIVYSQLFWYLILIAIQLTLFFLFTLKFRKYTDEYLGGSIALSFFFFIYLTNTKGKNEYKLAWLLPFIIFPWFGLFAYFIYHANSGGHFFKKSVLKVKKDTQHFVPSKQETQNLIEKYSDEKLICNYLINAGNYYPYEKNKISYLKNGEIYYPTLLEELEKAQKFIFIEYFIICKDEAWEGVEKILLEKAKQGVEIRVLYDGFGSLGFASKRYKKELEANGIKLRPFLKLIPFFDTKLNNRDHRKIVVIDGKVCFTGGINLSNEYFNIGKNRFPYWKDNGVLLKGQAVNAFTTMFLQNWAIAQNIESEDYSKYINNEYEQFDDKGLTIPYADDAYNDMDIAEDLYIHMITFAQNYIHITSPYLVIDNQMTENLIFACNTGKEVCLVLPSKPDHFLTFCIGRSYIKDLMKSGVRIYLYNKGFIHQKTLIADGRVASVGSVNFDYRSFYHHFECGVYMTDNLVINEIEKDFQEILQDCTLVDEKVYKKIPKIQLLIGRIFRIFAPLM